MKCFRTACLFAFACMAGRVANADQAPAGPVQGIHEAENARFENLTLVKDASASGGAFLSMADSGRVAWEIPADSAGWAELIVRYRSPDGEQEQSLIRNGTASRIGFGYAPAWRLFRTKTMLTRGLNAVAIEAGWGRIDLDYLTWRPVHPRPSLKPERNFFFRKKPRDMDLLVERFGRSIGEIVFRGAGLPFSVSPFPFLEDAARVTLPPEAILSLPKGKNRLTLRFEEGDSLDFDLVAADDRKPAPLTIVAPDVDHGSAVLFFLPAGGTLLVDCGQPWIRDGVLIPFLERHGVDTLDAFIVTHHHDDHDGGDRGETIRRRFHVRRFWDNDSMAAGQTLDMNGAVLKVLNAAADGTDENTRSLSFRLEYRGFVYVHGGDIYAENQRRIRARFPDDGKADVFMANHHFHGSLDRGYLLDMNPSLVIVQAQQAIYARSAYRTDYREGVENVLRGRSGDFLGGWPTLEVGTVVIRVRNGDDWTVETYADTRKAEIPYLK